MQLANRREFIASTTALAASTYLAGCTTSAPTSTSPDIKAATGGMVAPNANLTLAGMPSIDQAIANRALKYSDFRGKGFAGWHPDGQSVLVAYREKNTR
jgi:hypothetical protein